MRLDPKDLISIVNQVTENMLQAQREASRELTEGLKRYSEPHGKGKPRKYLGRAPSSSYYRMNRRNGLPSGVSKVKQKTPAWKVSFRRAYLGMYYSVEEAIGVRKAAEEAFDALPIKG